MQCRYCGAELPDGCAFCSQCGQPQQTEPAPPAPAAAPAAPPAEAQATPAAPAQTPAAPRKSPLKILLCCLLAVVVIAVILAQCSAAAKAQMLETAKTFTLGGNEIELGEAVETNLTNVEWTCYENDDEFWTVTLSGYNPNEDATVTILIAITELDDDQVYYEVTYGEVNGTGSMEAADINYAIAIIYDNVGQALVDSLTSYLLGF